MAIAALVLWILTAGGGFYLLARWVGGGGHRGGSSTKLPPAVVFGHFLLAAGGLVLWIVALALGNRTLAWAAFIVILVVALLGLAMFVRWIPVYRSSRVRAATGQGTADAAANTAPERSFPVAVVAAHGVLAVTTAVLVLLATLGMGTG